MEYVAVTRHTTTAFSNLSAMATAVVLLAGLLAQLILVNGVAVASPPPPTQVVAEPDARRRPGPLVQSTCNATSYYDLCVTSLAADPTSSSADVPGLCAIAVSAAAANASATAAFLLANATAAKAAGRSSLTRACAGRYADAREALAAARAAVAAEAYEDALVHVSAAAEYPAVCRALFRPRPPPKQQHAAAGVAYPPELAKREDGLRRLCTVALDIISLLLQPQQGHVHH